MTGPWVYNEGFVGFNTHFINCVTMFPVASPSQIFDIKGNSGAKRGVDYDWFCPVSLERPVFSDPTGHGKVGPGSTGTLAVCKNVDDNEDCKSFISLEERMSPMLEDGTCK